MKKSTKNFLFFTTATMAGMYTYNQFVAASSTKKNMLPTKNGSYYSWKQGNIFYTKIGKGTPILLIHDTNSASSSVEWLKVAKKLQKNHTVYTIDLLGCGLSDKPGVSYTNYMYVQLITSFIKDVIKNKTDVVASNLSSSFVIMANHMDRTIINHMIFINPSSFNIMDRIPDKTSKTKQTIINLPLIGTFIYNFLMSTKKIDYQFKNKFFFRSQLVSSKIIDAYYESSHMDNSRGKYLYSSILGNFMNVDIRNAVKKVDNPVLLIVSSEIKNNYKTIQDYKKLNKNIDVTYLSNCKLYPQLEIPEKIYRVIENTLSK